MNNAARNPGAAASPAYRIETTRLELRCWEFSDIPALIEAIDASLPELKRWLRWASDEPLKFSERLQRMRQFRSDFDSDRLYHYGVFERESGACAGSIALKHPFPQVHEIGYWLRTDRTGHGLMSEACAALVRVAFEVEQARVLEIRHLPDNLRSEGIPRRLGFRREATLRQRAQRPDLSPDDIVIWSLLTSEYPASPAAGAEIQAFDAIGQRLL